MNPAPLALCIVFAIASHAAAESPPPQDPQPPKKAPAKKPKPPAKPQPSRKDIALQEVRACDRDQNGKIEGLETMTLNNVLKNNPDSFLYLFDEDGNHSLDSAEIAAINQLLKPKKK